MGSPTWLSKEGGPAFRHAVLHRPFDDPHLWAKLSTIPLDTTQMPTSTFRIVFNTALKPHQVLHVSAPRPSSRSATCTTYCGSCQNRGLGGPGRRGVWGHKWPMTLPMAGDNNTTVKTSSPKRPHRDKSSFDGDFEDRVRSRETQAAKPRPMDTRATPLVLRHLHELLRFLLNHLSLLFLVLRLIMALAASGRFHKISQRHLRSCAAYKNHSLRPSRLASCMVGDL